MSTPHKPRVSGIPTPGKSTGIPTPRPRSASSANNASATPDVDFANRAFAQALQANDPAQHRTSRVEPGLAQSGRRSVAGGRPPSVASSSTPAQRARTPAPRPASRQSDVFTRSISRAGREFDLGDTVRIESLGFEGTLRFLGEIDGKPGIWAGVELAGGFAGRGKNDGRVGDKQYFTCDEKCGVFVATSKLSSPSFNRPSSVASSYSGRNTPSFSGRATPSANGRVTPSNMLSTGRITPAARGRATPALSSGRITPGVTPSARPRQVSKPVPVPSLSGSSTPGSITSSSRAAKYLGMTAKQLSVTTRDSPIAPRQSMSSPTRSTGAMASPTRGSPFTTPKQVLNGSRPSVVGIGTPTGTPSKPRPTISTPRARIPSAVAMPPPPSPMARSVSLNESGQALRSARSRENLLSDAAADFELNQRIIQEKMAQIQAINSGKASPRPESSRPNSSASFRSSLTGDHQLQVLQSRLDALEYENERLRAAATAHESAPPSVPEPAPAPTASLPTTEDEAPRLAALKAERDEAIAKEAALAARMELMQEMLEEQHLRVESSELELDVAKTESQRTTVEMEQRAKEFTAKLEDTAAMVDELKITLQVKEEVESEHNTLIDNLTAEVTSLEEQVEKAHGELEAERKELGAQVHELRAAGQETIALYEERLSAAETQRYDLEDRIATLEAQRTARAPSPTRTSRNATSAAEIDNEALRDQITHLQKKISNLEDSLEDMQVAAEKEEAAVQTRIKRYRDKEDTIKAELEAGKKEVERVNKAEAAARARVEEIEEAFRESAVALEDAQAEIEALRSENAGLGMSSANSSDAVARITEITQRATTERAELQAEIASLRNLLEASRATIEHSETASVQSSDDETVQKLEARNLQIEELIEEREESLEQERELVTELRKTLGQRTAEIDALKKKMNREAPVHDSTVSPSAQLSSRYDASAAKEEITGLKHIVQGLQKEYLGAEQRIKLLESENKLLLSETDQLRQEIATLEENLEQSIMNDENALGFSDEHSTPSDVQRALKDQKIKHETELELLRKRLTDAEMKSARAAHDFNKEIGELEALVESKIYREDELEQELEKAKEKLARSQRKASKSSMEPPRPASSLSSVQSSAESLDVCEICEQPGHDIFNCRLLKADVSRTTHSSIVPKGANDPDLYCEDCEGHGHTAANCPSSLDVF